MTYTEHKITLDIQRTISPVSLSVKKGDTGRRLLIHLTERGYPYQISKDCYAVFTGRKPDGKVVFNDCSIKDGVIIYNLTAQTVAAVGLVDCEIILYGADGKQLTSASFHIIVEDTIYDTETEIESTDEYNALTVLIAQVQEMNASMALTPPVVCEVEGETISISDSSNNPLQGLRIFGKSTQAATPTPDNPVEIVNLSTPVVTVSDGTEEAVQTLRITTPDSLPGIPVSSGGNYTDSNGQQWICDEVDLARGVYVQRLKKKVLSGNDSFTPGAKGTFNLTIPDAMRIVESNQHSFVGVLCDTYEANTWNAVSSRGLEGCALIWGNGIGIRDSRFSTVSEFSAYLSENPVTLFYVLNNPIETALTEDEIAAFAALHTYKPNTTIYNSVGAYMAAEYVADTKIYVDRNGGSEGSLVRVGSVTLTAAKWVGNASPYSQVVEIEGVTEYSQVDLTPSVEQLAIFHEKDLAFVTENEDGVVTVYAVGQKPTNDYTMQVTITEVSA